MRVITPADGHSVRFGKPKALVEVNDETFHSRVIKTLELTNTFSEIIISTNAQLTAQSKYPNVAIDGENHSDKGPLAGIYMIVKRHPEEELFFVVSVDIPMITDKVVSALYQLLVFHLTENHLDVAVLREDGRFTPAITFYNPDALGAIAKVLHSDSYSSKNVYHELLTDCLGVRNVDVLSYWYKNMNYQHNLDVLIQEL